MNTHTHTHTDFVFLLQRKDFIVLFLLQQNKKARARAKNVTLIDDVYLQQNTKGRKSEGKKCHAKTTLSFIRHFFFWVPLLNGAATLKPSLQHCVCTEMQ
jgi:hypothetical protein